MNSMKNIKLGDLLSECTYGTVAYIDSEDKVDLLEKYILKNLPILEKFKNFVISTNYPENDDKNNKKLQEKWEKAWDNHLPKLSKHFIHSGKNRGHHFGTADLDDNIIDYCQNNKIKWLCKTSCDTITELSILDKLVPESDLYYMNGLGMANLTHYRKGTVLDYERIVDEDFFPQTNFYILNISKIDYIYDFNTIDFHYEEYMSGKQSNIFVGWNCEDFLKQCVTRNKLTKFHLIDDETYYKLINYLWDYKVHDPSHKNIMLDGICHFHDPFSNIITI